MTLVVWYSDADDADDADDDEDADDDDDDDDEGADDEPFWDVTAAEAIPFAATWLTCQSVTWGIKAQSRGGLAWWDGGYEKGMWLGGRGGGVLSAAPRPVTLGLSGGAGVKMQEFQSTSKQYLLPPACVSLNRRRFYRVG